MVVRSPFIYELEYRTDEKEMSNFIITTGKKGSGKSWLGLRIGQLIMGDKFGLNNVCFSTNELIERLNRKEYPPGSVVVVEELGVSANARDAMTRQNKQLSFIAQTMRPARITIIANTISWGLIDPQVKNMADYRIKVLGYDKETGVTDFQFLILSPSDLKQEPKAAHMVIDGEKYTSWQLRQPTKELATTYNKMRNDYLEQIYSKGHETLAGNKTVRIGENIIAKRAPKTIADIKELGTKLNDLRPVYKVKKGWYTLKIREDFDCTNEEVRQACQVADSIIS